MDNPSQARVIVKGKGLDGYTKLTNSLKLFNVSFWINLIVLLILLSICITFWCTWHKEDQYFKGLEDLLMRKKHLLEREKNLEFKEASLVLKEQKIQLQHDKLQHDKLQHDKLQHDKLMHNNVPAVTVNVLNSIDAARDRIFFEENPRPPPMYNNKMIVPALTSNMGNSAQEEPKR